MRGEVREWRLADAESSGALGARAPELRHEIEYEHDDRPLFWLSYPMTGGKRRSPEFGAGMEIGHHRLFPESYRLHKLAELWEQAFPTLNAFVTDGIHPKEHFALYFHDRNESDLLGVQ